MGLHQTELNLIRYIQHFRSPFWDTLFVCCNYIDTIYFSVLLLLLVWLAGRRSIAYKMAIVLALSYVINKALKYVFGLPRPFELDPSVGILTTTTPGFPSGAAQTSVIICGIILHEWKSNWRWLAGPLFAIVLSFSRVYLGLHFATDLIGGWLVGGVLFWVYLKLDKFDFGK